MAPPDPWARGADPWAAAASATAAAPRPAAAAAPDPAPAASAEPPRPKAAGEDPLAGGDPWAAAAQASARPPAPAPRQEPQPQPWANFQRTGAGAAGGQRGRAQAEGKEKGKGSERVSESGGKAGAGKGAGRAKQTRKLGDWFVHPVEEEPGQWGLDGGGSSSSGIGRGKALIQPSWKTSTGLTSGQPPSLAEEYVGPPPVPLSEWQIAQAKHRQAWLHREAASRQAFASFEVEVKEPFDESWPGCWLACPTKGEALLVLSSRGEDLVYVMAHCRAEQSCGWVPVDHVQPLGGTGVHDFLVRLSVEDVRGRPIGLQVAKAEGAISGLVVVDVQPGSLIELWNTRCVPNFGRNQLLLGDVITWVNNMSEPEDMKRALRSLSSSGHHLRARVLRCALAPPCREEELRALLRARSHAGADGAGASGAGFGGCRAWSAAEAHVAPVPTAPTSAGAGLEVHDEEGAADPWDGMEGQGDEHGASPWQDMSEAGAAVLSGPSVPVQNQHVQQVLAAAVSKRRAAGTVPSKPTFQFATAVSSSFSLAGALSGFAARAEETAGSAMPVWEAPKGFFVNGSATNSFTPSVPPPAHAPGEGPPALAAGSMRAGAPEFVPAGHGNLAVVATATLPGLMGAAAAPSAAAAPVGGAAGGAVDPWQFSDPWGGVAGRRPDGSPPGAGPAAPAAPPSSTGLEHVAAPAGPAAAAAPGPPAAAESAGALAADGGGDGGARAEPASDDRASEPAAGAGGSAEVDDQEDESFL